MARLFAVLALVLVAEPALAACSTAGNNIFCDSCADAQNAPVATRSVLLSPNVTPNGGTQGSNNSFCRISNLAAGEKLNLTVTDTGSQNISAFEVDFNRVGANPGSLIPASLQNQSVPVPNGSITQSFVHAEAAPANTSVRANIADTQPSGQQPSVSGTVTCSCTPAPRTTSLTITKTVNGADKPFSFNGTAPFGAFNLSNGQSNAKTNLTAGSFEITETIDAAYNLDSISCVGNATAETVVLGTGKVTVPVATGENVICEFVNSQKVQQTGSLTIGKTVNGTNKPFTFTGNNAPFTNFALSNGQTISDNGIAAGTSYTITEAADAAYNLDSISCSGNSAPANTNTATRQLTVTVGGGENVVCDFVNSEKNAQTATLIVEKQTIGGNGSFTFQAAGNVFALQGGQSNALVLPVGQYVVTETNLPAGWTLQNISNCGTVDLANKTVTVNLTLAGATCTFTNFKKSDDPMEEETERFIHRRVDNLLTYGPDRARMLRRLQDPPQQQQSLKDEPLKLGAVSTSLGGASAAGGGSFGQMDAMSALPSSANRMAAVGSTLGSNPFAKAKLPGDETDDEEVVGYGQQAAPSMFSQVAGQFTPLVNGQGSYSFSTSLSELRAAAVAAEEQNSRKKLQDAGLSLASQPYTNPYLTSRQGLDVWVEGHVAKYDDNVGGISREGDFRLLYIGADYLLRPGFLIGALVQIDDTNEDIDDPIRSGKIDGTGWLAGPYVGIKVLENLYFDARAAWGQSDNDIELTDAAGSRSGSFDTDRWLATASLTGNERFGAWRFSPQIAIAYGSESSDAYTNSLGQSVGSTDAKIGRLTGTAEVGYRFQRANGTVIEPHVALTGIWNFDSDDLIVNGVVVDTEESRAKVDGGVLITLPSGLGVRGAASYDGIGADDYHAVSGSLWLNVPLN